MRNGLLDAPSLQRMLYEALDHSDDIVIVLEQSGDGPDDLRLVSANDAFSRTTGYRPADLIGRPLPSLVAPDGDMARCAEMIQAAHDRRGEGERDVGLTTEMAVRVEKKRRRRRRRA